MAVNVVVYGGNTLVDMTSATVTPDTLKSGVIAFGADGEAVTGAATLAENLQFTNKTVATSAWASNSTYSNYGYRAAISCSGVTSSHFPDVMFSENDALSGNFCTDAVSYNGGVYIYAQKKPSATVTIPTIYASK